MFFKDYWFIDYIFSKFPKKKIYNKSFHRYETQSWISQEVWVCFLPWRVSIKKARLLNLIPKNWKVIIYELSDDLVSSNPNLSIKIHSDIINDLNYLNLTNFNVLSISLGNYLWFFVSNNLKVSKFVSVLPWAELWESIYNWIATQLIKDDAIMNWYCKSYDYDIIIWHRNPIYNISNLPETIEIHISDYDLYIPTKYWERILNELENNNKKFKLIKYNWKWHILSLINFGINNKY